MKKVTTAIVVTLVLAALLFTGCSPATPSGSTTPGQPSGQTVKLVMQGGGALTTPPGQQTVRFARLAEELSAGILTIEVKTEGEIVPTGDATEAVSQGVLDMFVGPTAFDIGLIGPVCYLLGSSGFPGGPSSLDFLAWYYAGGGRDKVNDVYKAKGLNLQVMGVVAPTPPELFGWFNEPITSVDDFNGLTFRTVGPWATILTTFGAAVVTLGGNEVYEAAQRGVIDAFEYSGASTDRVAGFHEIRPYMGIPGVHSPACCYVVRLNQKKFDSLPPSARTAIYTAAEACSAKDYYEQAEADAEALQFFKEYGTKIFEVPPAVQDAIVERSYELVSKNNAEDALYASIWDEQYQWMKAYKALIESQTATYSIYT